MNNLSKLALLGLITFLMAACSAGGGTESLSKIADGADEAAPVIDWGSDYSANPFGTEVATLFDTFQNPQGFKVTFDQALGGGSFPDCGSQFRMANTAVTHPVNFWDFQANNYGYDAGGVSVYKTAIVGTTVSSHNCLPDGEYNCALRATGGAGGSPVNLYMQCYHLAGNPVQMGWMAVNH